MTQNGGGNQDSGSNSGSGSFDDWFAGDAAAPPQAAPLESVIDAEPEEARSKQVYMWPDGVSTEESNPDPDANPIFFLNAPGIQTDLWKAKEFTRKYRPDSLDFLGDGAMGKVHKALDKRTGQYVAI